MIILNPELECFVRDCIGNTERNAFYFILDTSTSKDIYELVVATISIAQHNRLSNTLYFRERELIVMKRI